MNRRIRSIGGCAIATQGKEDHLCSSRPQPVAIVLSKCCSEEELGLSERSWWGSLTDEALRALPKRWRKREEKT